MYHEDSFQRRTGNNLLLGRLDTMSWQSFYIFLVLWIHHQVDNQQSRTKWLNRNMQDNIVNVVDSLHGSMIKPLRLLFREMSNSFINIKKCPVSHSSYQRTLRTLITFNSSPEYSSKISEAQCVLYYILVGPVQCINWGGFHLTYPLPGMSRFRNWGHRWSLVPYQHC